MDGIARRAVESRRAFVRYVKDGPIPDVTVLRPAEEDDPRLSVIIPTLDGLRGGYLPHLLRQIEEQTFRGYEVIVVRGDRRQGRAINTAAAVARGEILLTMDDDTRVGTADLLERILETFAGNPDIGIVGVANLVPHDVNWLVRRAMRELPRRSSPAVSEITDSDMAEHPCLAIRRDVFVRIGGEHELLPRGLDPYLRQEVRALGYRVVVVPGVWIHHLLPAAYGSLLRQYFRNGAMAAYVQKFFPQFVIDQATTHGTAVPGRAHVARRALRYAGRIAGAALTGKWIYISTLAAYAAGYVWGQWAMREDSV